MGRCIVGTAGHIDHGKTALVGALTGVDTDRLPEEKARGITLDLGFAELVAPDGARMGVVDVPGHEDLVRTMVAGATGTDVVLLVVAADEGMMPQTREHLDIVQLLGVPRMVVALTKVDLVDDEWLALVAQEVRGVLADTPYADAPVVPTSCRLGTGLADLRRHLFAAGAEARPRAEDDLARLPVDRAFTVHGTGTVVTGTLWSGTLSVGERVRILPGDGEARIRSIQVHGRDTSPARAGERTALALAALGRDAVGRGHVVVVDAGWSAGAMLTVRARVLPGAKRGLKTGERTRVLLGTTEVMARCVLLDGAPELPPGGGGWVQLRLEEPVLARVGDPVVLRTYSPVLTVGGGVVVEPAAAKRRRLSPEEAEALAALASGHPDRRIEGALELGGWRGAPVAGLPQTTGLPPHLAAEGLRRAGARGALVARGLAFAPRVASEAGRRILEALDRAHAGDALRPSVPLERLRESLPGWSSPVLADGVIAGLARDGTVELADGGARRRGFRAAPTPDQEAACAALRALFEEAGLAAPLTEELPPALRSRQDLRGLLRFLEREGELRTIGEGLMVSARALDAAAEWIAVALGGRSGLGPADFRDVLPVTRRHLMPLLAYFDGVGVTVRQGAVRDVPRRG